MAIVFGGDNSLENGFEVSQSKFIGTFLKGCRRFWADKHPHAKVSLMST